MTDDELQEVRLPLKEFVREVAREAARTVIDEHRQSCAIVELEPRVRDLESKYARLIGIVTGAAIVGGGIGGWLSSLF